MQTEHVKSQGFLPVTSTDKSSRPNRNNFHQFNVNYIEKQTKIKKDTEILINCVHTKLARFIKYNNISKYTPTE